MGPCQSKSKQRSRKDLEQVSSHRKTDPILTNNNPSFGLVTFSPNQEAISEPQEKLFEIKVHQGSFSRVYSVIAEGHQKLLAHQKLVQHNLTGKIRIVETHIKNPENEQFIAQLTLKPPEHPKIVQVHEIFIEEQSFQIILDYCSGGPLSNYYNEKMAIPFSEAEVATMIYQGAEALAYLSKNGFTHGHLTLQSFSRVDTSCDFQIKFSDIRGLYVKHEINQQNVITLPPEACGFDQEYTTQRDVWGLGVLSYQMICGYPPFEGGTIEYVKSQIKKMAAEFQNFQFDRASKQCRQLIQKIIQPLKQRITLKEILKDDWFKIRIRPSNGNILKKLSSNKAKISPLQLAILLFMIKNFCSADQQELYNQFVDLDENGDGQLSKNELLKVYMNKFDSKQDALVFIEEIFKIADIDKSGTIDFGEFLVAITDKKGIITEENLKLAFKLLSSGNGKLVPQKLKTIFNTTVAKLEKQFADHFPNNKTLNYSEFESIMKQLL